VSFNKQIAHINWIFKIKKIFIVVKPFWIQIVKYWQSLCCAKLSTYKSKNNTVMKIGAQLLFVAFLVISLYSCKDQDVLPADQNNSVFPDIGDEAANIPEWIYEEMSFFYFWNDELTAEKPDGDEDPEAYFYGLLNANDGFSYISDDAEAIKEEITGTILAMGFSSAYGLFTNSDNLFAVVEYVYPNSPAELAGLKRGDIILKVDGQDLNVTNFDRLAANTSFNLTLGRYNGSSISLSDEVVSIEAGTIELDPVIHYEVKNVNGTKVGYLVYVDFLAGDDDKWLNSLGDALSSMKQEGITELVLDLRYNPGGEVDVASYLASTIAPASVVASKEVLVNFEYNDTLEEYFRDRQGDNSPNLATRFGKNENNLNLNDIYILTTGNTASASELVINGLRPYMNVVQIGESTFGKFYGSYVLYDQNEPSEHNWAIVPVVLKYSNATGVTDFDNGLRPDVPLSDNILAAKPFGDESDPLLKTALNLIAGEDISNSRLAPGKPYQPVYDLKKINLKNAQLFNLP
jgi:C-terminal processing protease CtpA/Prc